MMRRTAHTSNRFDRDATLAVRRGKDTAKLRAVIGLLVTRQPWPRELRDHPLKCEWQGYRDLHLESDWVLIYKADDTNLWLVRTGNHADLFGT